MTLLLGYYALYRGPQSAQQIQTFAATEDLRQQLQRLAKTPVHAVFHAAAVSDFAFGKVWEPSPDGTLSELRAGKLTTRHGTLLVELVSTPKVIAELRAWFPHARLVGWKFELEGNRAAAITKAERQITENRTDACVANGRAYGDGFGLVTGLGRCLHLADVAALYAALAEFGEKGRPGS